MRDHGDGVNDTVPTSCLQCAPRSIALGVFEEFAAQVVVVLVTAASCFLLEPPFPTNSLALTNEGYVEHARWILRRRRDGGSLQFSRIFSDTPASCYMRCETDTTLLSNVPNANNASRQWAASSVAFSLALFSATALTALQNKGL